MCSLKKLLLFVCVLNLVSIIASEVEDNGHWLKLSKSDIERATKLRAIEGIAKNVIVFVGDGLGLTTITTARIYSETESGSLAFETFPNIGSLKTYNADNLVPDSCSTATALFSGVKTNSKTSGVDPSVKVDDCQASLKKEAQLDSILKWAQDAGKATGFVTTTRITHATPSALYAHTPNRNWECEATMPADARGECKDIARQLIEDDIGKNINVIMGGGRQMLQSNATGDLSDPLDTWACYSKDGRDLIAVWEKEKKDRNVKYSVVNNNDELSKLDPTNEFVLGVFANGHLMMDYKRDASPTGMPSLSAMTAKSLDVLANAAGGYLLVVEGGLIDFGHHRGHARQALDETAAFARAVALAAAATDEAETLIIVTGDHAHSLVFSGYAPRGASVLDVAQASKMDGVPYTSLLYGTGGPNNFQFGVDGGKAVRDDPSKANTSDFEYSQQAVVLTDEVTHSGTDVLVYAKGPWSHLFHTIHEQTYVAHVVAYAAKIGPLDNRSSSASQITGGCIFFVIFLALFTC